MKNVNLTEEEIKMLQIAVCGEQLELNKEIDNLKKHNKTGINTNLINKKVERVKDLERMWKKLDNFLQ